MLLLPSAIACRRGRRRTEARRSPPPAKTPAPQHARPPKGYQLDRPALQAVFTRFDPARRGALGLAEFLALTLFLRSSTATFNAFDRDRTGAIKLSFNQFLCAAAHCV